VSETRHGEGTRRGRCPQCRNDQAQKVVYLGLPMRLCDCSCLFGFWAFVAEWVPIGDDDGDFAFLVYKGRYLPALWRWFRGD
jgi:hypothetical protein